jgi:SAM-dependent methyltransferase
MLKTSKQEGATQASHIDEQRRANDSLWLRPDLVKVYANRVLRPVEVLLLVRCREAMSGTVLELGSGAGRLTGYLVEIAQQVHGVDVSPPMVAYCRSRYPRGNFLVGDLRAVSEFEPASFDVVVAAYNVLDVLSESDRRMVLDGIHQVLRVGGLLIMSTHNRAYASKLGEPLELLGHGPRHFAATVIRLPRWLRNRRRVRRSERVEPGYAILNDISHDFLALHYYIDRDAQERQFTAHGFSLLNCFDLDGQQVDPGQDAPDCPELHYVAQRSADRHDPPVPAAGDVSVRAGLS